MSSRASGRPFAVPCSVCHHKPDHWRHKGGLADVPASVGLNHRYQPDESSVEWAALKLREALDEIIADHDQRLAAGYAGENMLLKLAAMAAGRQALALADAASIRPGEPSLLDS